MKASYPSSLNAWFEGFLPQVRMKIGPELAGNGYGEGYLAVLSETPSSRLEVVYTEEESLPDYQVIYTNNGQDEGWLLKLVFYGWGTFFAVDGEYNYFLEIQRWLEIHRSDWDAPKQFKQVNVIQTGIPKTEEISSISTGNVVAQRRYTPPDPDAQTSSRRYPWRSYTKYAGFNNLKYNQTNGTYTWNGTYSFHI
ncbi:hypothetical protein [Oceanidesulfovibrio marinus]|uniref:Uncharacterized protein n=1 Tax=Oceanidesulfovibrio marinus TaxID=370038 RepID=A0A6P1ZFH7_9BACT|nr:hypothetical protein [Oceanidesulfovibrio marinus]TVM31160.1 hypothetical protein DQK91_18795 [Oceanidesulfovibrio marinus]